MYHKATITSENKKENDHNVMMINAQMYAFFHTKVFIEWANY